MGAGMSIDGIGGGSPPPPPPTTLPQYALTGSFNGKPVVVGANARFGGAIYSIKLDGQEYLDSTDHGRELQTAWQYNGQGEGNNPTEAGSAANGSGPSSSSVILHAASNGTVLTTRIQPAYWYPYHARAVSLDYLEKTVTLGHNGRGNVLVHDIGMYIGNPYNSSMAVEGLTAYMPLAFSRLFTFARATKTYTEVPPSPSLLATSSPVLAATPDLSRAIALVHVDAPGNIYWVGKIGGWPKLDCSWFSINNPVGWYRWRCFTVFGSLQDVLDTASVL